MTYKQNILRLIDQAYTGNGLKHSLAHLGLAMPANVTNMYLAGESAEYIMQACLSIAQIGE